MVPLLGIGILDPIDIFLVSTSFDFKHYSYMKKLKLSHEYDSSAKM